MVRILWWNVAESAHIARGSWIVAEDVIDLRLSKCAICAIGIAIELGVHEGHEGSVCCVSQRSPRIEPSKPAICVGDAAARKPVVEMLLNAVEKLDFSSQ